MTPAADAARTVATRAIASVSSALRRRVHDALPPLPPAPARVTVVAVGKAAPMMAAGALDRWGARIARALVVTTDATDVSALEGASMPIELVRSSHPLPDERSAHAAARALDVVRGGASDLVVALVSGGASALVSAPVEGLSLDDKRALVADLVGSGAPISDVNVVRRHLSRIKGGGLARVAMPGRVLTLVASDVLVAAVSRDRQEDEDDEAEVGPVWDVGSGPTVPDPTTIDEAARAVARWTPRWLGLLSPLFTTPLPAEDASARRVHARIIASPLDLAEAARREAEALGYRVQTLPPTLASVDALSPAYAKLAAKMPRRSILLRVGEPSVSLPPRGSSATIGHGGRAGRIALATWLRGLPEDVALACIASDGVDGTSGNAGAVVSGIPHHADRAGAQSALDELDDGPYLRAHGVALPAAPTGNNLLDLHVLVRA